MAFGRVSIKDSESHARVGCISLPRCGGRNRRKSGRKSTATGGKPDRSLPARLSGALWQFEEFFEDDVDFRLRCNGEARKNDFPSGDESFLKGGGISLARDQRSRNRQRDAADLEVASSWQDWAFAGSRCDRSTRSPIPRPRRRSKKLRRNGSRRPAGTRPGQTLGGVVPG